MPELLLIRRRKTMADELEKKVKKRALQSRGNLSKACWKISTWDFAENPALVMQGP